ncbi:CvpA family protein [Candidatus Paracaedibacter symbiosus]|uniref:CvpA family protein n=1 Tax=Candidatus Paracaedibacter symbiosus TaxID=244582 RepID=UPI000509FE49|nr:CvpA family protein [Candidatus Paracaedibacter symbiosus]
MNSVDIGILVIFGISCLAGFMRGFTREILGVFTWVGSAVATYIAVPLLGGIAKGYIANPMIADAVTAVVLFIFFLIIFSIISGALANSVKRSSLGSVDHALGVSFGIVRAVVIICGTEIILSTFTLRPNQPETIQNARFIPMIRHGADSLSLWLPHKVREFITTQQAESGAKNPPHHPQNPHVKSLDEIVSTSLTDVVAEKMMQGQPEHVRKLLQPKQQQSQAVTAPQATLAPKPEEDREKTAESLAKLTPQAMDLKGADGDYNTRQRRDLDRLVQINQ